MDQVNGYLCQCAPGYTDLQCWTGAVKRKCSVNEICNISPTHATSISVSLLCPHVWVHGVIIVTLFWEAAIKFCIQVIVTGIEVTVTGRLFISFFPFSFV